MIDKRRRAWVTAALAVGMLVSALDMTIVDTAFPKMISELGGVSIFSWVITVYLLASTAVVPVVGKLADIYGRKTFYMLGLTLFVGGSMLCGAAQNMTQLILFRGLQGLGAGMLQPLALTIIGDLYPGAERAKMQGLFGGVFGLAAIAGPKLGGWLTHNWSWRWVFYVNLPVGIVAAMMMYLMYRESRGERRPIDFGGAVTVTAGVVFLLLGLVQGGDAWGWTSPLTLASLAAAAVLLSLFVWLEGRAPEPVLDLNLFRNRTFTTMSLVGFLMGAGMFGAIIFVPWFIQGVVGVNPNVAGTVMMPMMLSMVTCAFISGRLALRIPYRAQLSAGFALVAAGFVLMTRWSVDTTQLTATWNTMVMGAGMGLMMPIITLAVQNAFPAQKRGVVTSAATFFRQVGSTVGVTIFSVIFNNQMAQQFQTTMAPRLAQAGPLLNQAPAGLREMLVEKPQSLVQLLLREELQQGIPAQFLEPLKQGIRTMMSESLHTVFWTGLGVMVVGALIAQFMRNTSLRTQSAELGLPIAAEAPAGTD